MLLPHWGLCAHSLLLAVPILKWNMMFSKEKKVSVSWDGNIFRQSSERDGLRVQCKEMKDQ